MPSLLSFAAQLGPKRFKHIGGIHLRFAERTINGYHSHFKNSAISDENGEGARVLRLVDMPRIVSIDYPDDDVDWKPPRLRFARGKPRYISGLDELAIAGGKATVFRIDTKAEQFKAYMTDKATAGTRPRDGSAKK